MRSLLFLHALPHPATLSLHPDLARMAYLPNWIFIFRTSASTAAQCTHPRSCLSEMHVQGYSISTFFEAFSQRSSSGTQSLMGVWRSDPQYQRTDVHNLHATYPIGSYSFSLISVRVSWCSAVDTVCVLWQAIESLPM